MCKNPPKVKYASKDRKSWDERIDSLMKEFCVPYTTRREIIRAVDQSAKETDTDGALYMKAHNKFKAAGFFLQNLSLKQRKQI